MVGVVLNLAVLLSTRGGGGVAAAARGQGQDRVVEAQVVNDEQAQQQLENLYEKLNRYNVAVEAAGGGVRGVGVSVS